MSGVASEGLVLDAGVTDFLERHGAGEAFQTVREVVRTCFPELRSVKVWLLDDPDEDGRTWAVLQVSMPASHPPGLLQAQRRRYHEELARQLPLEYNPLFALSVDFTQG
jgi:hypothetical protein